jgi:cytochrome c oxidase subunit II
MNIPRPRSALVCALGCALLLAGCGGRQSVLDPHSKPTRQIEHLWWGMLAAATVVVAGALVLLAIAWRRRTTEGLPVIGKDDAVSLRLVILFGIAIPVVALSVLFWVADLEVGRAVEAPAPGSAQMRMTVIGHQWFWEVRYPGTGAVSANEIHIPTRTRIDVLLESTDVIHSFWVPALNKKVDMLPGHPNHILLYADRPGIYRGQCAEFCGLQHANMALEVFADPPARFRTWLANESRPALAPATAEASEGRTLFMSQQCASCHEIRGGTAAGMIGPDLTHMGSRTTLAGLTIPNTPARLAAWIDNPQSIKPGAKMPGLGLTRPQTQALVTYLEGLK